MKTDTTTLTQRKQIPITFWVVTLALVAGLILSVLSWMELCVEHCSANRGYNLLGMPFAVFGLGFFIALTGIHLASRFWPVLTPLVGWMVAGAFGSEIMFIAIQKYRIGHWCPVCLSIAFCVLVAAVALAVPFAKDLVRSIKQSNREDFMNTVKRGITSFSFALLGFFIALVGITKPDEAQAAVDKMKERLNLGAKGGNIEVYFISDWFCPSCKKVEPKIEKLFPKVKSQVAFYFIDYPIHTKSLNFTPYNLAFLVNDKSNYLSGRRMLMDLAEKNESPTDEDIEAGAKAKGLHFHELSFLDVKRGMEYFDEVIKANKLDSTPTVIIRNIKTNKTTKLEGTGEISEAKVLEAIDALKEAKKA